jgi:hypothetical protein
LEFVLYLTTLPFHANILLGVSPLYHGVHENQPDFPLAVYNLGLAHLNSGNKSEALQYFTRYKRDYAQNLSQKELERLKVLIQKCMSDS